MLFEKRQARRESRAETMLEDEDGPEDISVFPLAIPLLAGPGSIAAIMIFMSQQHEHPLAQFVVVGAMLANLIIALILMLIAPWLLRVMGHTVGALITRVFGVILAALSVQLIFDGIKNVFFT